MEYEPNNENMNFVNCALILLNCRRPGREQSTGQRLRVDPMAKKLIIIMVNTDPRNGEELGAPFFQATVAAAMDYEVEVICTATAGQLMKKGVAEKLVVKAGSPKTVYDFIKDAHEAGVKFYCCSPNLDLFDMSEADLIPECGGIVGGAKVIEEVMEDDEARVLTY
jgi:predicted peroxiredoxin